MGTQQRLNPEAPEFFPNQRKHQHYYLGSPPLEANPLSVCTPLISPLFSSEVAEPIQLIQDVSAELSHVHLRDDVAVSKAFISSRGRKLQRRHPNAKGFRLHYVWRPKGEEVIHSTDDHHICGGHFKNSRQSSRRVSTFLNKNKHCHPVVPVQVDGDETTVMIKNIPSKYTRAMLLEFLDNHCLRKNQRENEANEQNGEEHTVLAFDFLYLPIDFKSGLNKGYAFVNFTNPKAAWKFHLTANNQKWDLFQSHKIREVVAARLQGMEKLKSHFENMNFPCESEEVLPVLFDPPRDGVVKGEQKTIGRLMKLTNEA